jgi:predicted DNA-binding protein
MSAEVTLTLPDTLFERAQLWARQSERPVAEFLTEAIESSLQPLGQAPHPLAEWTGEEVLSASACHLTDKDDQRLSELLALQREGGLAKSEDGELNRLMLLSQEGLVRKAMGLREAVRRGLRKPPES